VKLSPLMGYLLCTSLWVESSRFHKCQNFSKKY